MLWRERCTTRMQWKSTYSGSVTVDLHSDEQEDELLVYIYPALYNFVIYTHPEVRGAMGLIRIFTRFFRSLFWAG